MSRLSSLIGFARRRLPHSSGERRKMSSFSDGFFEEYTFSNGVNTTTTSGKVQGEALDHSMNMKRARPGDVIPVPYEMTITEGLRDFWGASFYSNDRMSNSTPFARKLGLQDQVLPFGLMLYLVGSMSHADAAVVQVAYRNAHYLFPAFAGDTFTKVFRIKGLRTSADGSKSMYDIVCELINQRQRLVFKAEKTMIFPWAVPPSATKLEEGEQTQWFKEHIIGKALKLAEIGGQSLKTLRKGKLVVHSHCRPITLTQSMSLSSLGRLTHHRHYNTAKYGRDELMVPGGLVIGLAISVSAQDLHEMLHEELLECNFINPLRPGDIMGAVTYIKNVESHVNGVLEKLTVVTVGIKGMDVRSLKGTDMPLELFTTKGLQTKQVEKICAESCPVLSDRIVCIAERVIIRQAAQRDMFLL